MIDYSYISIISICLSLAHNKYKTPSKPKLEIELSALSFFAVGCMKSVPKPAKFNIGKIVGSISNGNRLIDVDAFFSAIALKYSAFFAPSISPRYFR
jgi:hypothetical protein